MIPGARRKSWFPQKRGNHWVWLGRLFRDQGSGGRGWLRRDSPNQASCTFPSPSRADSGAEGTAFDVQPLFGAWVHSVAVSVLPSLRENVAIGSPLQVRASGEADPRRCLLNGSCIAGDPGRFQEGDQLIPGGP